ncbi:MAG: hypothetical protein KDD66_01235, partial [Bdellovibrionales bacterium]|nr:hypothetical protein [Bdellovibrionales bacterium]
TIVKTDGPKPLAELDTIFSLMPFSPKSKNNRTHGGISNRKGEKLTLKIQRLVPRRNYISLAEE